MRVNVRRPGLPLYHIIHYRKLWRNWCNHNVNCLSFLPMPNPLSAMSHTELCSPWTLSLCIVRELCCRFLSVFGTADVSSSVSYRRSVFMLLGRKPQWEAAYRDTTLYTPILKRDGHTNSLIIYNVLAITRCTTWACALEVTALSDKPPECVWTRLLGANCG